MATIINPLINNFFSFQTYENINLTQIGNGKPFSFTSTSYLEFFIYSTNNEILDFDLEFSNYETKVSALPTSKTNEFLHQEKCDITASKDASG